MYAPRLLISCLLFSLYMAAASAMNCDDIDDLDARDRGRPGRRPARRSGPRRRRCLGELRPDHRPGRSGGDRLDRTIAPKPPLNPGSETAGVGQNRPRRTLLDPRSSKLRCASGLGAYGSRARPGRARLHAARPRAGRARVGEEAWGEGSDSAPIFAGGPAPGAPPSGWGGLSGRFFAFSRALPVTPEVRFRTMVSESMRRSLTPPRIL